MSMAMRSESSLRVVQPESFQRVSSRGAARDVAAGGRRRSFMIVEPQALVRHGLALTLSSLYDGAHTWQTATPDEALTVLGTGAAPDVILMDVDGLGAERTVAVVDFLARIDSTPAIVMAGNFTAAEARTLLSAGAAACLLKSDPSGVLADAVGLALAREGYVQLPYRLVAQSAASQLPDGGLDQAGVARLTNRQRDIFRLLLSGCSNKEIARQLGVLEGTVKVHVRAMMQKLGARNRTQIAILAARTGLRPD